MNFNKRWLDVYPEIPKSVVRSDIKTIDMPDGPKTKGVGGNLKKLLLGPKFLVDLQKKYGNTVSFYVGGKLFIAFFNANAVQEIYVTKHQSFIKGIVFRKIRMMLGDALLTSENPVHFKHKRMIQPSFHKNKIENYLTIMFDLTQQQAKEWSKKKEIKLYTEIFRLTLKVVSKSLFGVDSEKYENRIHKDSTISSEVSVKLTLLHFAPFLKYLFFPLIIKYKMASNDLTKITNEIIQERIDRDVSNDLLDMLIHAEDVEGNRLAKEEVRDEALGILLAGHETTATTLTWAMMWLSSNPENLNKLKQEAANQQWIQENRPPTIKEIMETSFVDQVIHETLRLSSPSWINMRQAIQDVTIDGVFVPRGTHVVTSQYVTHRQREYYENSTQWKPERWTKEFHQSIPKGAYFPFAIGTRRCIGDQFAMLQMKISLLFIAHNFTWKNLAKKMPNIDPRVTLRPKGEVPISIQKTQVSVL
jgi:cytochrome P450